METSEIITKSAGETKKIGADLAGEIKKQPLSDHSLVIGLEGNLGSGKTTFIQGLAREFKIKENILSPTFLILKQFPIKHDKFNNLYHIDAYRLKNPKELLELGFGDLIKDSKNIIVIEWADRIKELLPKNNIWIKFKNLGENRRKINL